MVNWPQFDKKKPKLRRLWDSEFNIVKDGLDEKQVIAFVENLINQQKASHQVVTTSLRALIEKAVTDGEQIATSIKIRAQKEAEDEAAIIISQAKQEAEEIKRRAGLDRQKDANEIVIASNRKAEIIEVEAKQKALLFFLKAREEIEKEIRNEFESAYSRLSSSLNVLMNEVQDIEMELKGKRDRLWESKEFELKEFEAALLDSPEMAVPSPDKLAHGEIEIEPDIASTRTIIEAVRSRGEDRESAERVDETPGRQVVETRDAKEAQKQAEKAAKLAAKEEAKRKAEEAKKIKEAQKQAEKAAKLAAKEEAKRKAEEAEKAKEERKQAEKADSQVAKKVPWWKTDISKRPKPAPEQPKEETKLAAKEEVVQAEEFFEKKEAESYPVSEAAISSPVEAAVIEPLGHELPEEELSKDEKPSLEKTEPIDSQLASHTLYSGEVELYIPVPVELKMVSRLYNHLQTIPELKILHTRGSWDRGTTITVVLDKPLPLISLITKVPDLEITPELQQKDSQPRVGAGSLLKTGGKGVKGIKLVLKEPQSR